MSNHTNTKLTPKEQINAWTTEYEAIERAYMHYDNFAWQVGSTLIAGVFMLWGLILLNTEEPPPYWRYGVMLVADWLVTLVMSIWFVYTCHCRYIYLFKLQRAWELELRYGIEQNIRFVAEEILGKKLKIHYEIPGPSGYQLNYWIYFLITWGHAGLTYFSLQAPRCDLITLLIALPLIMTIGIYVQCQRNAKKVQDQLHTFMRDLKEKEPELFQ